MFVTAGDTIVRLWQVDPPQCIGNLKGHEMNVLSIQWANESERILSGGYDNTVRDFDENGWRFRGLIVGTRRGSGRMREEIGRALCCLWMTIHRRKRALQRCYGRSMIVTSSSPR